MSWKRGGIYGIRISLHEALSLSLCQQAAPVSRGDRAYNTTIPSVRPCLLLNVFADMQGQWYADIAPLASFGASANPGVIKAQDEIEGLVAKHFAVQLGWTSANRNPLEVVLQTVPPWPLQGQYITACVLRVSLADLLQWQDSNGNAYWLPEAQVAQVEMLSAQKMDYWKRISRSTRVSSLDPLKDLLNRGVANAYAFGSL